MTVKTQHIYYDLLLQGYMFRLLRVIIRPSNEPTQDYLIPSALWDPRVHYELDNLLCFDCHLYVFIVISNTSGCLALSKQQQMTHQKISDSMLTSQMGCMQH